MKLDYNSIFGNSPKYVKRDRARRILKPKSVMILDIIDNSGSDGIKARELADKSQQTSGYCLSTIDGINKRIDGLIISIGPRRQRKYIVRWNIKELATNE